MKKEDDNSTISEKEWKRMEAIDKAREEKQKQYEKNFADYRKLVGEPPSTIDGHTR